MTNSKATSRLSEAAYFASHPSIVFDAASKTYLVTGTDTKKSYKLHRLANGRLTCNCQAGQYGRECRHVRYLAYFKKQEQARREATFNAHFQAERLAWIAITRNRIAYLHGRIADCSCTLTRVDFIDYTSELENLKWRMSKLLAWAGGYSHISIPEKSREEEVA
jgi:hypothetical protein